MLATLLHYNGFVLGKEEMSPYNIDEQGSACLNFLYQKETELFKKI